jgi:hypothetical protein
MNFYLARRKLGGKYNFLANIGMLGDTIVAVSLYLFYKYRKDKKEAGYEAAIVEETKQNLYYLNNLVLSTQRKQKKLSIINSLLIHQFLIMLMKLLNGKVII